LAASRAALRWTAVATLIALAGCARREVPAPPPRPIPTRPVPPPTLRPLATTSYVATAASIDLYDIRAGELAMQRSTDGRIRDYAARLVEDHKGTAAQLSYAGRRLNLLPSAEIAPPHQALYDALAATSDFDGLFRRQQLDIHQSAQRMHAAFAARGDSPTLRPVALNAAEVEARHLASLRSL
jgi:putative membrane protein